MRGFAWILSMCGVLGLCVGCGDSQQAAQQTDTGNRVAATGLGASDPIAADSAAIVTPQGLPDLVVARFYQALRDGDNTAIEALLTDRAREETAKNGLAIQSQASRSLSYEIGETDYVTENLDGAHVASLWAEPEADGSVVSTEVIWVLRKQRDGWKISGMATAIEDGELPLLFNFENPVDMMQKKSYVESRLASREEPASLDSATVAQPVEDVPPEDELTAGPEQASVTEIRNTSSISDLR